LQTCSLTAFLKRSVEYRFSAASKTPHFVLPNSAQIPRSAALESVPKSGRNPRHFTYSQHDFLAQRLYRFGKKQNRRGAMRLGSIVMLVVALTFGVAAAFLAKTLLESDSSQPRVAENTPPVEMGTIVVAAEPLRYGVELSRANLRELQWPANAVPSGAFAKIGDILNGKERRVALAAIEVNEPVLNWKITGAGQRASLSARIDEGRKAVSIRVTDVFGVSGFVLPGERVDILLTRRDRQNAAAGSSQEDAYTDVLLQDVPVLAADQLVDERSENPAVAKTVTVAVTTEQAQKLALASSVGQLSLILRGAGSVDTRSTRRVSLSDLNTSSAAVEDSRAGEANAGFMVIGVVRQGVRSTYNVPYEFRESDQLSLITQAR
jgi:pilus assembly protein CpaB